MVRTGAPEVAEARRWVPQPTAAPSSATESRAVPTRRIRPQASCEVGGRRLARAFRLLPGQRGARAHIADQRGERRGGHQEVVVSEGGPRDAKAEPSGRREPEPGDLTAERHLVDLPLPA